MHALIQCNEQPTLLLAQFIGFKLSSFALTRIIVLDVMSSNNRLNIFKNRRYDH